jgi:hypothetical protein
MTALANPELTTCTTCRKPFLPGYPHRHETPLRPDYNPMPAKPPALAALVALIRAEYLAELPVRLHVSYVPNRAEPIAVSEYSAAAAGYVATAESRDSLDTGELGAPSWSPAMHRRVGGVEIWGDALTVIEADYRWFPWALAIERRLPAYCRRRHVTRPELWREHREQPICQPLVLAVIAGGNSLYDAAAQFSMTPERCTTVLEEALGKVWAITSNLVNEIDLHAA